MSDSDNKSSTSSNAKNIALHGTGLLLSTLGAAAAAHAIDFGQLLQNHPTATMSIAGAGGTILYAWASWTYSLHKRDSKRELVRDARTQGRPICDCTPTGEIMLFREVAERTDIQFYQCPHCKRHQYLRYGDVTLAPDTKFVP